MYSTHTGRDPEWFDALVTAHRSRILAFLRSRLIGDAIENANDLMQETFMTAWQKRASIPDEPTHWLYATATNHLRNHRRRQHIRRLSHDELTEDIWVQPDPSDNIDGRLDIATALLSLSPHDRMVIQMRYIHELASEQIAAALSVSPAAARKRLNGASQRLRQRLTSSPAVRPPAMTAKVRSPLEQRRPSSDARLIETVVRQAQQYWIRQHLEDHYRLPQQSHSEQELSVSLAAFIADSLSHRADPIMPPADCGVDAMWFDQESQTIHLVQCKWVNPDRPFGEDDLIDEAERLKRTVSKRSNFLEQLVGHPYGGTHLRVTLAISASPPSRTALDKLSHLYRSEVGGSELITDIVLVDSSNIYDYLPKPATPANVLKLSIGGTSVQVSESLSAILCVIPGDQIARWPADLVGDDPHHQADTSWRTEFTLRYEPSRFWYLNTGLTIHARMLHHDPASPSTITLEHATIVNGSHTFMSILEVASTNPESAAQVQVLVRIVLPVAQQAPSRRPRQ